MEMMECVNDCRQFMKEEMRWNLVFFFFSPAQEAAQGQNRKNERNATVSEW